MRGLVLLLWALTACGASNKPKLVVAAASDLTNALPELASAFFQQTGVEVVPTFGASKLLATQIEQGAPFQVFLSANIKFVDDVVSQGKCDGASKSIYARGHLALWSRAADTAPKSLAELADPRFVHVAIANPDTAPYGAAAKQALETAGVWPQVEGKIVRGENIRQTLQLAESGNVEAAIVSRSLAIGSKGSWVDVDEKLHDPIEQALVVCRGDDTAKAFAAFVSGPEGQAILGRWGLGR